MADTSASSPSLKSSMNVRAPAMVFGSPGVTIDVPSADEAEETGSMPMSPTNGTSVRSSVWSPFSQFSATIPKTPCLFTPFPRPLREDERRPCFAEWLRRFALLRARAAELVEEFLKELKRCRACSTKDTEAVRDYELPTVEYLDRAFEEFRRRDQESAESCPEETLG
ncbi:unnamed protein product [Effrenium voratum]|nr:unnamed protein product [Effrenium voratum]